MSLSIRLSQTGRKGTKSYRIVVVETRSKRDGKATDSIGFYNANQSPPVIKIDKEKLDYWLSVGAQPTKAVRKLTKI